MKYKKYSKNSILIYLILVIASFSCVSSKKYEEALGELARMKVDSSEVANELATVKYNTSKDLFQKENLLSSKVNKIDSLQELFEQQKTELAGITTQLKQAFPDIPNEDLNVFVEDGYMHLSMDHRVLFNRGESVLGADGEKIIAQISQGIRNIESDIMILGHTDTIPFYPHDQSNWDLSIDRAMAVMKVLVENGVSADRVILAGRSKHDPMIDNSSQIGRLLNRRVELVLMPDMRKIDDLFSEYIVN